MVHAAPYHPKSNHPWRRYSKRHDGETPKIQVSQEKVLKGFFASMVEDWDSYKIDGRDAASYEPRYLKYMSDVDIAHWLIDFLSRNIIKTDTTYL